MGRPKGSVNNPEREETQEVGQDIPDREKTPVPKACPNCGAEAILKKDNQGMYRCHCQACGYWDSVANYSEYSAVSSWNAAGGIPKADY